MKKEVDKPLLVFWTAIKKLDSPVENPATHSGCKLLFLIELSRFSVAGIVIGNASFKSLDKPVLREALILTIFLMLSYTL